MARFSRERRIDGSGLKMILSKRCGIDALRESEGRGEIFFW
jgi:hypothetical protein